METFSNHTTALFALLKCVFLKNSQQGTPSHSRGFKQKVVLPMVFIALLLNGKVWGQIVSSLHQENHNSRLKNMAPVMPLIPFENIKSENSSEVISATEPNKSQASQNESDQPNSSIINYHEDDLIKRIQEIGNFVNVSQENRKKYDEVKNKLMASEKQNESIQIIEKLIQIENPLKYIENLQNDILHMLIYDAECLIYDLNN
jgi:hypothetical protein